MNGISVIARGITARTRRGLAFENVHADIEPGDLVVLAGSAGSGRTALLAAFTGRLPLVAGYLEVAGRALPRAASRVRRSVPVAQLGTVRLEPTQQVTHAVRERRVLCGASIEDLAESFALVGIDPEPTQRIAEMHPGERILLATALAITPGKRRAPTGVVVDDVDAGLPNTAAPWVWSGLARVAEAGMTVLTSAADPPAEALVLELPARYTAQNAQHVPQHVSETASDPWAITLQEQPVQGHAESGGQPEHDTQELPKQDDPPHERQQTQPQQAVSEHTSPDPEER